MSKTRIFLALFASSALLSTPSQAQDASSMISNIAQAVQAADGASEADVVEHGKRHLAKKWGTMTSEEKKSAVAKQMDRRHDRRVKMREKLKDASPEERAAAKAKLKEKREMRRERRKEKFESLSPEQKEKAKAYRKERREIKHELRKERRSNTTEGSRRTRSRNSR
ncbi:MAG: hypothetical protein ACN2B6_05305 [Rickettsiales bacterium]